MPKTSFKKKKYNARFPPARIKKIMQMDEEVGKVAAAVPVIISRALEMFIESLMTESSKVTQAKSAKTLSTSHIKQTITGTKQFDFLRDLVKDVPDHQVEENGEPLLEREPSTSKRGRGRPRMSDGLRKSRKSKGNKSSSEDEDDDDNDDAEDTETDEESATMSYPVDIKAKASHLPIVQPNTSYQPNLMPNGQQHQGKPNIEHLLHAASSLQHHSSPFHPSVSDNLVSHNNNNIIPPPSAGSAPTEGLSVLKNSSGKNTAPILHHQSLPLSSNYESPHSLVKQPLYQMPSNFEILPSSQMPLKVSFNNNGTNPLSSSPYIQSPVSQKLSMLQHQPIDLSHPLRQNVGEDDDYDT